MGELHKNSLEGVKLEGKVKDFAPILAFFFGFWFTLYVAFTQKEDKRNAILIVAVLQFLTVELCLIGWIWAIMWAIAAKKQS